MQNHLTPFKMTITKQAAFSLLEGLTEKNQESLYRCNRVWEAWQIGTMTEEDFEEVEAPVTLLEILSRIDEIAADPEHPITEREKRLSYRMDATEEQNRLLLLWKPFGFKTPLRDILEGAAWEWGCANCVLKGKGQCARGGHKVAEVLKDEKVEALLDLLINLQLTK